MGLPDGSELISEELTADKEAYKNLGKDLARRVIERGAKALLERAEVIALNEVF